MRSLVLSAAVVAAFAASAAAGDSVVAEYKIDNPEAGAIELNFFQFGYTNPDDEFVPLTGFRIEEARLTVNFRPGMVDNGAGQQVPFDVDRLRVSMLVPVILDDPTGSEILSVEGADMIETAPGVFSYELTSDAFNGEIRPGRFSLDIGAFDENGEGVPMAGAFFGGSGFYYTVAVPEPAAISLLGLGVAGVRRRRK